MFDCILHRKHDKFNCTWHNPDHEILRNIFLIGVCIENLYLHILSFQCKNSISYEDLAFILIAGGHNLGSFKILFYKSTHTAIARSNVATYMQQEETLMIFRSPSA